MVEMSPKSQSPLHVLYSIRLIIFDDLFFGSPETTRITSGSACDPILTRAISEIQNILFKYYLKLNLQQIITLLSINIAIYIN